jgi:hypothetical protein
LIDDVFVLFNFGRTRTIDQHPAGSQAESRRLEDLELHCVMPLELSTALSPLGFRMPTQDAETAARRVDENPIEPHRSALTCNASYPGLQPRWIPKVADNGHQALVPESPCVGFEQPQSGLTSIYRIDPSFVVH